MEDNVNFVRKSVFMSDRIKELVEEIRGKASDMRNQLTTERARNKQLEEELNRLKASVSEKEEAINALESKCSDLERKQDLTIETGVEIVSGPRISDTEIDELVKEIEYCIAQLKR